jgi:ABC-type uncharacterized transport system permease subunit
VAAAAFTTAAALYAASSALFLAYLAGAPARAARWAVWVVGAAAAVHFGYEGLVYREPGVAHAHGIHQTLSTLSLAIVLGYLVLQRRGTLRAVGAFVTPIALLLLFGARFVHTGAEVPERVRGVLLAGHITSNLLGDAALTVAFGASVAYLLAERALKQKRLVGAVRRLPPLDVLEAVDVRCIGIAVPLLTVGLVTGAIWAMRVEAGGFRLSAGQIVGVVTWAIFGTVWLLRLLAGWRGRRAAVGTIVGYAGALLVLVSYLLRPGGG